MFGVKGDLNDKFLSMDYLSTTVMSYYNRHNRHLFAIVIYILNLYVKFIIPHEPN